MKISKKKLSSLLDEYKEKMFIKKVLSDNNITPFDFFDNLENFPELKDLYNRIQSYNNKFLEDQIAVEAFANVKPNAAILLELMKYGNKAKYIDKKEVEDDFDKFTLEELQEKLDKLTDN